MRDTQLQVVNKGYKAYFVAHKETPRLGDARATHFWFWD